MVIMIIESMGSYCGIFYPLSPFVHAFICSRFVISTFLSFRDRSSYGVGACALDFGRVVPTFETLPVCRLKV